MKPMKPKARVFFVIFGTILIGGGAVSYLYNVMTTFMGTILVILAALKLLDLRGFAKLFAKYDLIAKRSSIYSWMYPFIELGLGISFILGWQLKAVAAITAGIMTVGAIGVGRNLFSAKPLCCACLGTYINVPLTKFTLLEDIVMVVMALMVLLGL